jgi:hypothetical protein
MSLPLQSYSLPGQPIIVPKSSFRVVLASLKLRESKYLLNLGAPLHEWAKTNILEKPKDFIQEWVIKGRSKIIRRKPFEIIVPDAVAYDEAQSLIAQIQTHQSSSLLDHSKAEILSRKCRQLQTGVNTLTSGSNP